MQVPDSLPACGPVVVCGIACCGIYFLAAIKEQWSLSKRGPTDWNAIAENLRREHERAQHRADRAPPFIGFSGRMLEELRLAEKRRKRRGSESSAEAVLAAWPVPLHPVAHDFVLKYGGLEFGGPGGRFWCMPRCGEEIGNEKQWFANAGLSDCLCVALVSYVCCGSLWLASDGRAFILHPEGELIYQIADSPDEAFQILVRQRKFRSRHPIWNCDGTLFDPEEPTGDGL